MHTTKSWNWSYLTYQIGPIINQFLYHHYSILSILCSLSLSTTALHKHEKGSCSAISAIQATRDQGFNQKTISGQKTNKMIMKSWWKKALTESLKNWHSEEKWAMQVKYLAARGLHTHKCCLCKVYKPDIFQTNVVAKMGHRNWSHNHCDRSDTKLSVFTTTRAELTELYTQVPSPSTTCAYARTHAHTHTKHTIHTLSMCCVFCLLAV